jgi:O-antigen ligase
VHALVAFLISVSFSALFLHVGSSLVETMGRDATLTGRTGVWDVVLGLTGNPLFGTGFESFWLGQRLEKIWSIYWWHPNEAHNGYLEVYLNLGWIGIALLAVVLVTSYRNIVKAYRRDPNAGGLRLAYFVTGVAYNFTESAIRIMHPVWIFFLLAAMAVPGGWTPVKPKKTVGAPVAQPQLAECMEEV